MEHRGWLKVRMAIRQWAMTLEVRWRDLSHRRSIRLLAPRLLLGVSVASAYLVLGGQRSIPQAIAATTAPPPPPAVRGFIVTNSSFGANTYTAEVWGCDLTGCGVTHDPINDATPSNPLVDVWFAPAPCDVNGCGAAYGDPDRSSWAVGPTGHVKTNNPGSSRPVDYGGSNPDSYRANFYGDLSNITLNKPIVGMSPTADNLGYWMVASDGGIFSFGDAKFYGSAGAIHLNKPIVGMSVTPTGNGYWMVASDGGVFSYGDATFYGSTGNLQLVSPISGMMTTAHGYRMVAADGGVFDFGDATFAGSMGGQPIPSPITAMVGIPFTSTSSGYDYGLAGRTGELYGCKAGSCARVG